MRIVSRSGGSPKSARGPFRFTWTRLCCAAFLAGVLSGCDEPLKFMGVEKVERAARVKKDERGRTVTSLLEERIEARGRELPLLLRSLGASEMKRFNAAERMYAKDIRLHRLDMRLSGDSYSVYSKTYRDFSGYEVLDLEAGAGRGKYSDAFPVRYDFRVMSTEGRFAGADGSLAVAATDDEFSVLREGSLVLRYPYNFMFGLDETYEPQALEWPSFFGEMNEEHFGVSVKPVDAGGV